VARSLEILATRRTSDGTRKSVLREIPQTP
jgi:hypothetical protein